MTRTKRAPDPADRQWDGWGIDAAALCAQDPEAVTVVPERDRRGRRTGRTQTAHRGDVFARLNSRGGLALELLMAVRRLEADLETARGEGDPAPRAVVDCASASREIVTARMLAAAARASSALGSLSLPHARMLQELLEPRHVHSADILGRARVVIAWATGRRDRDAQHDQVRQAAHSLAVHYGLAQPAELSNKRVVAGTAT